MEREAPEVQEERPDSENKSRGNKMRNPGGLAKRGSLETYVKRGGRNEAVLRANLRETDKALEMVIKRRSMVLWRRLVNDQPSRLEVR